MSEKSVLVIGMGISGRAAARFLIDRGAKVVGVDRDAQLLNNHPEISSLRKKGLVVMQESILSGLTPFSLAVASPGIPPTSPLFQKIQKSGIEIIGEIELACRYVKNRFIGITGTNGKTTVTLLVAHVLNHAGMSAKAVGNIGYPLTSEIEGEQEEIIVCELSSYQIETLRSRVIDVGMILNVTPDHLDRYPSMEAYAAAKALIGGGAQARRLIIHWSSGECPLSLSS